jgi:thiol-disulfide isomerase/thioredoxin
MSSLPNSPLPPNSSDARPDENRSQPELVNAPAAQSEEHVADLVTAAGQPPTGAAPPPVRGGGRNPLALVVVAVIAAGMLYFGFHMSRRPGPEAPAVLGKTTPAPDFTLESLDGKDMRLSDFHGKAVLLNFWATWCGPCKIEMPWFVDFQKQYGSQGLQIVGVAMDDSSKEDIAKFAKEMGVNYPVLLGKEAVGDEYGGVPALPESFFIGRDGKIVDKIIGLKGKGEIEDSIKKALDTSAAPASTTASAKQPQK